MATYRRERGAGLPHKHSRWGSVPHPAIGGYLVSIDCKPKVDGQESGANPEASKGEPMKYITKIHRVEAVKYNGSNKSEIEALVSDQLENFVYPLDNGNLLLRDGTVHIGDWVVLDGIAKILSHGQFMELYEEASGEEYIERRAK